MATVRAHIGEPYGYRQQMVSLPGIEIPDADYRNEKVIAQALRDLADELEKGAGFLGVNYTEIELKRKEG